MSMRGSWRATTKIGTPSWWSPPQPPAGSNVPRPATTAPVDMNSSYIWPLTPDGRPGTPEELLPGSLPDHSQSCRRSPPSPRPLFGPSLGPAMNPSIDMDEERPAQGEAAERTHRAGAVPLHRRHGLNRIPADEPGVGPGQRGLQRRREHHLRRPGEFVHGGGFVRFECLRLGGESGHEAVRV